MEGNLVWRLCSSLVTSCTCRVVSRHDPVNIDDEPSFVSNIGIHPTCWLDIGHTSPPLQPEKRQDLEHSISVGLSLDTRTEQIILENIPDFVHSTHERVSLAEMIVNPWRDFPDDGINPDDFPFPLLKNSVLSAQFPFKPAAGWCLDVLPD